MSAYSTHRLQSSGSTESAIKICGCESFEFEVFKIFSITGKNVTCEFLKQNVTFSGVLVYFLCFRGFSKSWWFNSKESITSFGIWRNKVVCSHCWVLSAVTFGRMGRLTPLFRRTGKLRLRATRILNIRNHVNTVCWDRTDSGPSRPNCWAS